MDQRHVDTLEHPGLFDRFAVWSASVVSRAPFFAFCVLLVVAWAPTYPLVGNFDTWQLLVNTPTTILTFLLPDQPPNAAAPALRHRPTNPAPPPPQPLPGAHAATAAQNQAIHTCRFRFAKPASATPEPPRKTVRSVATSPHGRDQRSPHRKTTT